MFCRFTIYVNKLFSIQSFNNAGPLIWNTLQKKVNLLVPIAKFKIASNIPNNNIEKYIRVTKVVVM